MDINQEWLKDRLDKLDEKMDRMETVTIPNILVKVATITTEKMTEAKTSAKIWGIILGGIGAITGITSIVMAYFRS